MSTYVGRGRKARRAYGFDEIAIVPGRVTINPEEVDTTWELRDLKFTVPILAAAMDGVVDTRMAIQMSKLGGLGVLNLEGVQTRYEEPGAILEEIAEAGPDTATQLVQKLYAPPIQEKLDRGANRGDQGRGWRGGGLGDADGGGEVRQAGGGGGGGHLRGPVDRGDDRSHLQRLPDARPPELHRRR